MANECAGFCAVSCCLLQWLMTIVISSMLIAYRKRLPDAWTLDLDSEIKTSPSQVRYNWLTKPFTDITVVDADDNCPASFPDEVIYNVWPGTRMMCDCIDRSFEYFLDQECKKGKNGEHNSEDCIDVGALPPVV